MSSKRISPVSLVLFLVALAGGAPAQPRIYLVHDTPEPMKTLASFLERNGHRTSIEDQPQFRAHMKTITPEAIFMYVHGNLDDDIEARLISYAEMGGRLIIVHHGMASGKMKNKRWLPFLGVTILPRESLVHPWAVLRGNYQLVQLNASHYITTHRVAYPKKIAYTPSDEPSTEQQLPAIELPDTELFLNHVFVDGRRKTVLLGMKGQINGKTYMQDRGGWMMQASKGYVLYFMPGHFARDFENPNYAQILLNAVEWRPGTFGEN